MSAWCDDDHHADRLESYGQSVGDNSIDAYGNWQSPEAELAAAFAELAEAQEQTLLVLAEIRRLAA